MRSALVIAAFVLLGACAGSPEATHTCPDTRPEICTLEYVPTCGLLESGERKEFSSPCNACADAGVIGYDTGACPQ